MAKLPTPENLGTAPVPVSRRPVVSQSNAGIVEAAEGEGTGDIIRTATRLQRAGERIWQREESVGRLRAKRDFRTRAREETMRFMAEDAVTDPNAVNKFNELLTDLEKQTLGGHGGRADSRITLATELQSIRDGAVSQVAAAGFEAQQKMIGAELEEEANLHLATIRDNPGALIDEFLKYSMTVDGMTIGPEKKTLAKRAGLASMAEGAAMSFVRSGAFTAAPGEMNDLVDVLQHPDVKAAMGPDAHKRVMSAVAAKQRAMKPSAIQEKLNMMVQSGVDENTARGIVSGRFVVSVNPQDQSRQVIDISNGQQVGGEGQPPIPVIPPSPMPKKIDLSGVSGLEGVATNFANILSDAFGFGPYYPQEQEVTEALTNLNVRTTTLLQSAVPGRPSKFLLERLGRLAIEPNSFTMGEARSRTRLQQTRDMVHTEIVRMDGLLTQKLKPNTRQEIQVNKAQLEGVRADYDQILESIGPGAFELNTVEDVADAEIDDLRSFLQRSTVKDLEALPKEIFDAIEARFAKPEENEGQ